MKALKEENRRDEPEDSLTKKLPKLTLQKLTTSDNVEHFLATFEQIVAQQDWPRVIWVTQVAGLLSGKVMAAYAAFTPKDTINYDKVKDTIILLRRYEINEEIYYQ